MIFVVQIPESGPEESTFLRMRQELASTGSDIGIHVVTLHDDILSTMHSV